MASANRAVALLRAGGREWWEGERVRARGVDVLDQETLERAFPSSWQSQEVEGTLIGQTNPRKFVIRWDSLSESKDVEYGAQHKVFRASDGRTERKRKRDVEIPRVQQEANASESQQGEAQEGGPSRYRWEAWQDGDESEEAVDPYADYDGHARLAHPPGHDTDGARGPLWYFRHMVPTSLTDLMIEGTNRKFSPTVEKLDKEELDEFMVIVLFMAFEPCEKVADYWNNSPDCLHCDRQMLARFGMTRKRWFEIKSALSFWSRERASEDRPDPWHKMRRMVKCFNIHMHQALSPGDCLVLREQSVKWDFCENLSFPQASRKEEDLKQVGILLRSLQDSETGMVVRLEINEGQEAMKAKKFTHEAPTEHSSCALRLCEKYFGSKRIVIGNGPFACTGTALALTRFGLQFMGMMERCDEYYPKGELERSLAGSRAAADKTLTCKVEGGRELFAIGWREMLGERGGNLPLRFFLSTRIPGARSDVEVTRQYMNEAGILKVKQFEVKAPDVVRRCLDVNKSSAAFDDCLSTGLRNGTLWPTDNFHILVFQYMLSLITVNAYLAYKKFELSDVGGSKEISFKMFLGRLVKEFSSSHGPQEEEDAVSATRAGERQSSQHELSHTPSSCSSLPSEAYKKGRCKELTKKGTTCQCIARYFCPMCSDFTNPDKPKIFFLCGMKSGRDCSMNHVVRMSRLL
ncbi:hypothetical protein GUITHDRAFT_99192 [Guillardia theta CCMP2712]|uniref:PiggyBac transposable element-derived protein domain-containing protein n=2 Tax=Guillardia theta TaxID=55529 RepID=L1K488_GUITC|nr:hypothetical protein GUITHDRAFT_99192 [Guillardia theta CCMP2712]EKX55414.1 hypothetical protein GUITHDRAFT_99192 [Guillardia theta CCMP2712]|eukprot:XP_005842394.1 hypothetical protein GUITHDRAFT_99192 [Guillardia theta CCMP2712]